MSGRIAVDHYLYFPTEEQAVEATRVLRERGYTTQYRRSEYEAEKEGSTGESWLVLANHSIDADDLDALDTASEELMDIAAAGGGEYDGYERDVQ